MSQDQFDKARTELRQVLSRWNDRRDSYGSVRFGSAIIKDRGAWRNLLTYFLPLHKTHIGNHDARLDYGDVKIVSGSMRVRKALAILSTLTRKRLLSLPEFPEVSFDTSGGSNTYNYYTWDLRFPVLYPYGQIEFSSTNRTQIENVNRMLYSPDLPLFPSIESAIAAYLDTRLSDSSLVGSMFVLTPDYRGRLWELKLSSKGIKATVQCPLGSRPEDLIGKVYAAYQPEHIADHGTVEIEDGVIQFPTKDFPSRVIVAILDRRTGELVDRKDTHMGGVHGLSIESAPEDLENLALAGESDVLEYKGQMPSGPDLAKEIVAFTNSKGGTILIGVTDEGEIVGFEMPKLQDHVTNVLRSHCDPPISVAIEVVTIREMKVAVLKVPQGRDKPYLVRDRGPYIRVGATSRRANRYELDQMQAEKSRLRF